MAKVDKDLLKELNEAKRAPRNFAFVNAPAEGGLLMSRKKIAGSAAKEKQKECGGGGLIIRGRCKKDEDGKLLFETMTNVSDGLSKKLRETIKEASGVTFKAEFRQVESIEEIDEDEQDEQDEQDETELESAQESAPTDGAPAGRTVDVWRDAKEQVNGRLSALQNALRQQPDPDFKAIADKGLNGITQRLQVGLQVTLMEFDGGQGEAREKARTKARAAVADFEKFLASDEMVGLVDDNPFGVAVGLRSTLGEALGQLGRALNA